MVDRLVYYSKTKVMKKLILYISIIFFSIISYSQEVVRPIRVGITVKVRDSLILESLASDNFVVFNPTSTGKVDTTETSDISEITIDTLTANVFVSKGTYNGYQTNGTTPLYYHEHNAPAFSTATGASGATITAPTANTLGGYQLDVNTEQLYHTMHIEGDWVGSTDIIIEIYWEVNEATAADGTVDLQLICYYKGDHEATNKTQTLEEAHTITGNKAQYTQHLTTFTINWDETDNVVEVEDILSFILNLETDTSECDDVIINHILTKYQTTKPSPQTTY